MHQLIFMYQAENFPLYWRSLGREIFEVRPAVITPVIVTDVFLTEPAHTRYDPVAGIGE